MAKDNHNRTPAFRGARFLSASAASQSALLLRDVLGPVTLKPMAPQIGKPYYQAETTLQIVELLDDPEGGSNWLRKWTRTQPIRTAARIPLVFSLIETRQAFSYQAIAERAHHLRRLRMSDSAIGRELGVTDKTVAKAVRWFVTAHTETKHRQS